MYTSTKRREVDKRRWQSRTGITAPGSLNYEGPSRFVAFNSVATDAGGALVFSWLHPNPAAEQLVESFAELADDQIASAVIRYAFEFSENVFWSPTWWESIGSAGRQVIHDRFIWTVTPTNARRDDALLPDRVTGSDWGVVRRIQGF